MRASKPNDSSAGMLKVVALVLWIIDIGLLGVMQYASGRILIPELVGSALVAPVIFMLLVLGIARLFKRARGPRGAARVAIGVLVVVGFAAVGGLVMGVNGAGTGGTSGAARLASNLAATDGKNLPRNVDAVTELHRVAAANDTVVYDYRLTNMTAAELDQSSVNAFRAQVVDHACHNASLRDGFLRRGGVIRHRYSDSLNAALTSVEVTEAACGGRTPSP